MSHTDTPVPYDVDPLHLLAEIRTICDDVRGRPAACFGVVEAVRELAGDARVAKGLRAERDAAVARADKAEAEALRFRDAIAEALGVPTDVDLVHECTAAKTRAEDARRLTQTHIDILRGARDYAGAMEWETLTEAIGRLKDRGADAPRNSRHADELAHASDLLTAAGVPGVGAVDDRLALLLARLVAVGVAR